MIAGLQYNPKTKSYEIVENGIVYSMQLEQTRIFKRQINGSVLDWYNYLDKETKKKITRTGNISEIEDNFYPDQGFD